MKIDFSKSAHGLIPAIIQDNTTLQVLMLGYMNAESFQKTIETGKVTFFSRSKSRLWTKGEESGNFLNVVDIKNDCDDDTLLIKVNPVGPTCHTGTDTCWAEKNEPKFGFLSELETTIAERKSKMDTEKSYIASLFQKGINKFKELKHIYDGRKEQQNTADTLNKLWDKIVHLYSRVIKSIIRPGE